MTLACMMRIRNESRWIARVIESILPTTESIFILDDHSTDATREICRRFPTVRVIASPFEGLDETRDKNYLLEQVRAAAPFDVVIHIDGDEILEPHAREKILAAASDRRVQAWSFPVLYMWDRPDQWRTDGVYGRFLRPSMFRMGERTDLRFKSTRNGGNFHCGNTPAALGRVAQTDIRLLHMGYLDREDRIRKYLWYNANDANNSTEDCYRHIVQGDLPDIPADARLRHAGPLTLQPFQI